MPAAAAFRRGVLVPVTTELIVEGPPAADADALLPTMPPAAGDEPPVVPDPAGRTNTLSITKVSTPLLECMNCQALPHRSNSAAAAAAPLPVMTLLLVAVGMEPLPLIGSDVSPERECESLRSRAAGDSATAGDPMVGRAAEPE